MRHALKIRVSKERMNAGLMTCRQVTVREKLLRFLFGNPVKLTVIVPGNSVEEVAIMNVDCDSERGGQNGQSGSLESNRQKSE